MSEAVNLDHSVVIDYTNHRGERGMRHIMPSEDGFVFKATDWHHEPQWILTALDLEKYEFRDFALKDIHSWRPNYVHG
jgi:predicted DNA-binding transcriptional regulator YafY